MSFRCESGLHRLDAPEVSAKCESCALAKENASLRDRIREFDESIDSELRDPNGTIWEVACRALSDLGRWRGLLKNLCGATTPDEAVEQIKLSWVEADKARALVILLQQALATHALDDQGGCTACGGIWTHLSDCEIEPLLGGEKAPPDAIYNPRRDYLRQVDRALMPLLTSEDYEKKDPDWREVVVKRLLEKIKGLESQLISANHGYDVAHDVIRDLKRARACDLCHGNPNGVADGTPPSGWTPCPKCTPFPVPLVLYCPAGHPHVDEGEWATKPHKTHQCQVKRWRGGGGPTPPDWGVCGLEWRPAEFPTVGVKEER